MIDEQKLALLRKEWELDRGKPLLHDGAFIETLEILWPIVRKASQLIYPPRSEYAAGSKKGALRDALKKAGIVE